MNIERDKFITEYIGECWHETSIREYELMIEGITGTFLEKTCSCGEVFRIGKKFTSSDSSNLCQGQNNNFSSWEGFGKLFQWCQKQHWFEWYLQYKQQSDIGYIPISNIDPDKFADSIHDYLFDYLP